MLSIGFILGALIHVLDSCISGLINFSTAILAIEPCFIKPCILEMDRGTRHRVSHGNILNETEINAYGFIWNEANV